MWPRKPNWQISREHLNHMIPHWRPVPWHIALRRPFYRDCGRDQLVFRDTLRQSDAIARGSLKMADG